MHPLVIDHTAFPHIFEHILAHVTPSAYPALRATCQGLRQRIDHLSVGHLALHDPGDGKAQCEDYEGSKGCWSNAYIVGADLRRIPVLEPLMHDSKRPPLPLSDTWKLLSAHTTTLDLLCLFRPQDILRVTAPLTALHTVRLRLGAFSPVWITPYATEERTASDVSNDLEECDILVSVPTRVRRFVIFPGAISSFLLDPPTPEVVEKVVVNVVMEDEYCWPLVLRPHECHRLHTVVIIIRPGAYCRSHPSGLFEGIADILLCQRSVTFVVVDFHHLVPPEHLDVARASMMADIDRQLWGYRDVVGRASDRIQFMTLDDYRETVTEEDFCIETVENM